MRARVLARRAEIREAEALAREALALAEATDFVTDRADALLDLSKVLEASHRCEDAAAAAGSGTQTASVRRGQPGTDASIFPALKHVVDLHAEPPLQCRSL